MTPREANADLLAEITALRDRVAALTRENAELQGALAQGSHREEATSEILHVISSSPTDVQPVFDTIVQSAVRLCDGLFGCVFRFDGELMHLAAHHNYTPKALQALQEMLPMQPQLDSPLTAARAILTQAVVHVEDVLAEPGFARQVAQAGGFRSLLAVPMQREGNPLGAIFVARERQESFSDRHIELLKTFADQAVIAIENVRLFMELQEKNRALTQAHSQVTESLEQQTATSEILRVIAGSPTNVQPVFESIVRSAAVLCGGVYGAVYRRFGDMVDCVAQYGLAPEAQEYIRRNFPRPVTAGRSHHFQRALLDGAVVSISDIAAEYDVSPRTREFYVSHEGRSVVLVPLVRQGEILGVLGVGHRDIAAFGDRHVELLKTFADQAVIAIENVRLFTELQASNRELTTALDTQTATSDILRVISQSQTDVQPVFDAIVTSAVRLLAGYAGTMTRVAGDQVALVAFTSTDEAGDTTLKETFPRPLDAPGTSLQAIRDRVPVNIANAHIDPRVGEVGHAIARARRYQSMVAVPMLRHDEALGAIAVTRREQGGFTDDEIALLKTFADQAVIAIENVRLFKELEARTQELTRSVGELRALSEVGQAISSTLDLQAVLTTMVAHATHLSDTDAGVIYEYDQAREVFLPRATAHLEAEIVETMLATPVRKGEGATGRLAEVPQPIQVPDILAAPAESRVRGALVRAAYRALLAVPLVREGHLIGGLTVIRRATGAFPPETIELLQTFATQSSLAIQNARLFREIEEKSRQLEVASQHKSEFLANMSHELRTPLNAIIGFSEVLTERMFGELNEKQEEYLKDIYASGTHLLSLINDILDLSKIEAGRMELELTDFDLPTALDSALTLIRERAGRRGITLQATVDERLGEVRADERKIRQVVLNLLSNAIKFTPEGGRIDVRAASGDGVVEVSVSDTGVGIAPEDQEAIFEEFRQVGTSAAKQEGTGLGLALCRKFVELHGGRIRVQSEVGAGSKFTFTIPVRRGE